jgi:hypothetical protein
MMRFRYPDSAPTLWEIENSLSFSTTTRSRFRCPAWLSPSKASPLERDPSPMTATTRFLFPSRSLAAAIPRAAEIDVPECPVPKAS